MKINSGINILLLQIVFVAASSCCPGQDTKVSTGIPPSVIQCARIVTTKSKQNSCFSERFLNRLSAVTRFKVDQHLYQVDLESKELFKYPFAVLARKGPMGLSPTAQKHLKNYLLQGGFLLVSPQCSDKKWTADFNIFVQKNLPEAHFELLDADHPLMRMVYKAGPLLAKNSEQNSKNATLRVLRIHNKIAAVCASDSLGDAGAIPGCACTQGFEIINSEFLNVNILAYALTH